MMWRQLRNSDSDNHDNDDDNNNNNNDNNNHHHNFKNFSLHERVGLQLKECLDSGFVPSWLTKRRTSLLQKDKSKGNVASIYRPITCLSIMKMLLTGVIAYQIYAHLDQVKLLPEEQKGCRKGSRGTKNLL